MVINLNLKTRHSPGVSFMGLPFDQTVANKIDKVVALHSTLPLLEDVQVKLFGNLQDQSFTPNSPPALKKQPANPF